MNTVVPFALEVVWRELDRGQFSVADFDPFSIRPFVQRRLIFSPLWVVVAPMSSMITPWLTSGRPRQFCVM